MGKILRKPDDTNVVEPGRDNRIKRMEDAWSQASAFGQGKPIQNCPCPDYTCNFLGLRDTWLCLARYRAGQILGASFFKAMQYLTHRFDFIFNFYGKRLLKLEAQILRISAG
jgi:hypothetical protein